MMPGKAVPQRLRARRFLPIYMRYKWTKWRFQERRGYSAKVRS